MTRIIRWLAVFGLVAASFSGAVKQVSASDNCQQLEALSKQYAGVTLTVGQEKLKRRLVVWYEKNCHDRRSANAD
jgi:hypothetical protein